MLPHKILVAENENFLALNFQKSLKELRYKISENPFSREESVKLGEIYPDLVLISIWLTRKDNGIQVADIIRIFVLYFTGYLASKKLHNQELIKSCSDIVKPFAESELHIGVEMAIDKHQTNKKLQEEKQKMVAIINSMQHAVVVTYPDACVQFMNPMAEALTGWQEGEAHGKNLTEVVKLIDKDIEETIENLATQTIATGKVLHLPDNCVLITKNGREILVGDYVAPIRDSNDNITGAVLVLQEVTQRKRMEAQLLQNAFYDGLTALPNRALFLDRLKQAVERSKRRIDYRFGILFLDLDGFKEINDRFGHAVGDDLLVAIGRRLDSCLRSGDSVGRFSGDEFAVLLEDIKDISDAINVAKRIQDTLGLPLTLNGNQISTTASIGITINQGGSDQAENLLQNADAAMYHAKQQGKARYAVFDVIANN
ncbi:diguanylate cyclase [Fortiea sp. LEGE XX443]|uniref:diguanylate cyclase domain-containing protein n=1 Tax=Fortiea sp. LEGE XX443 TaxID=1828611 RepID=UPI0018828A7A|nr:diguanylate cyclase [Fortiea sp. LEGE XX443]MBE9005309.1 diguanylate cyclase [Fortiea sp. LEGE XX443]